MKTLGVPVILVLGAIDTLLAISLTAPRALGFGEGVGLTPDGVELEQESSHTTNINKHNEQHSRDGSSGYGDDGNYYTQSSQYDRNEDLHQTDSQTHKKKIGLGTHGLSMVNTDTRSGNQHRTVEERRADSGTELDESPDGTYSSNTRYNTETGDRQQSDSSYQQTQTGGFSLGTGGFSKKNTQTYGSAQSKQTEENYMNKNFQKDETYHQGDTTAVRRSGTASNEKHNSLQQTGTQSLSGGNVHQEESNSYSQQAYSYGPDGVKFVAEDLRSAYNDGKRSSSAAAIVQDGSQVYRYRSDEPLKKTGNGVVDSFFNKIDDFKRGNTQNSGQYQELGYFGNTVPHYINRNGNTQTVLQPGTGFAEPVHPISNGNIAPNYGYHNSRLNYGLHHSNYDAGIVSHKLENGHAGTSNYGPENNSAGNINHGHPNGQNIAGIVNHGSAIDNIAPGNVNYGLEHISNGAGIVNYGSEHNDAGNVHYAPGNEHSGAGFLNYGLAHGNTRARNGNYGPENLNDGAGNVNLGHSFGNNGGGLVNDGPAHENTGPIRGNYPGNLNYGYDNGQYGLDYGINRNEQGNLQYGHNNYGPGNAYAQSESHTNTGLYHTGNNYGQNDRLTHVQSNLGDLNRLYSRHGQRIVNGNQVSNHIVPNSPDHLPFIGYLPGHGLYNPNEAAEHGKNVEYKTETGSTKADEFIRSILGGNDFHELIDDTDYLTGNGRYVLIADKEGGNHRYFDTVTGNYLNIRHITLPGDGKTVIVPGSHEEPAPEAGVPGLYGKGFHLGYGIYYLGNRQYRYQGKIFSAANMVKIIKTLKYNITLTPDGLPLGHSHGNYPINLGYGVYYLGNGSYRYRDQIIPADKFLEFIKTYRFNIPVTADGFPIGIFNGTQGTSYGPEENSPIDLGNNLYFLGNGHYKYFDKIIPATHIFEFVKSKGLNVSLTRDGLPLGIFDGSSQGGYSPVHLKNGIYYLGNGYYRYLGHVIPASKISGYLKSLGIIDIPLTDDGYPVGYPIGLSKGTDVDGKYPIDLGYNIVYLGNGEYTYKGQKISADKITAFIKSHGFTIPLTPDGLPLALDNGNQANKTGSKGNGKEEVDKGKPTHHPEGNAEADGEESDLGHGIIYLGKDRYKYLGHIIPASYMPGLLKILGLNLHLPHEGTRNQTVPGSDGHSPRDLGHGIYDLGNGTYRYKNRYIPAEYFTDFLKILGYRTSTKNKKAVIVGDGPESDESEDTYLVLIDQLLAKKKTVNQSTTDSDNTPGSGRDLGHGIYDLGNGTYRYKNRYIPAEYFTDFLKILGYRTSTKDSRTVIVGDGPESDRSEDTYLVLIDQLLAKKKTVNQSTTNSDNTPDSGRDLGHGIYDLGNGTYRYKNRYIPSEYFTDFLNILGYHTSSKNKKTVIVGDGPGSDKSEDTYLVLIDQLLAKKKTVKQSTTNSDNTPDSGRDLGHGIYDLGNGTYRYKNRYIPSEYFTDFLKILGYRTSTNNKKTVIVGDGPESDESEDTYLVLIDQLLAKKKTVKQSTTNSDNTPDSGRDLGHGIYDLGNGTYRYKNRYIPAEYFTDFLKILGYRTSTKNKKAVIVGDGPESDESEDTYLVLIDQLLAKKKTVKQSTTNSDNTPDSGRDLGHGIYDLGNGTYRYKNRYIPAEYFTDFLKILGYRTSTKNKKAVIVGDGPESDESEDTYLVLIDQLLAKKKTVKQSTTNSDNTPDSGRDLGHGIYDLGNGTYRYKNRYIPAEYFTDFLKILGYRTSTKNKKAVIVGDGPESDESEDTYLVLIDQLLAKKKTVKQSTTDSDNTPDSGRDLGHGIYDLGNGTYRYKNRYIPAEYFTDFLKILGYRTSTKDSRTVIVGDGPESDRSEDTYLVLIDQLLAKKKTVNQSTTNSDNTPDSGRDLGHGIYDLGNGTYRYKNRYIPAEYFTDFLKILGYRSSTKNKKAVIVGDGPESDESEDTYLVLIDQLLAKKKTVKQSTTDSDNTPGSGRDLGHGIYDLGNGTYRYKNRYIPSEYFTDFIKILGYRTSTKNKKAVIVGDGPESDRSEDTYLVLIDQLLAKKKTVNQSTTNSDNTPDSGRVLGHGVYDLGNGTYRYKNRYIPSEYFTDFLKILGYRTSTKNKKAVIVGDGPESDESEDTYLVLIDQLLAKKKTVKQSTTDSDNTPGSGRDLGHGIYDLGNGTYRYKNRYIPSEYFTDFLNILGYHTSTKNKKTVIVGDGPDSDKSEDTYLVLIDQLLAKKKTVNQSTTNSDNTPDSGRDLGHGIYDLGNGTYRYKNRYIPAEYFTDFLNILGYHTSSKNKKTVIVGDGPDSDKSEDTYLVLIDQLLAKKKTVKQSTTDSNNTLDSGRDLGHGIYDLGNGTYRYKNRYIPAEYFTDFLKILGYRTSTKNKKAVIVGDGPESDESEDTYLVLIDQLLAKKKTVKQSTTDSDNTPGSGRDLGHGIYDLGNGTYRYKNRYIPAEYFTDFLKILGYRTSTKNKKAVIVGDGPESDESEDTYLVLIDQLLAKKKTVKQSTTDSDNTPGSGRDLGHGIYDLGNGTYRYKNRYIPAEYFTDFLKILGYRTSTKNKNAVIVGDGPDSDESEDTYLVLIDQLLAKTKTVKQSTTNSDNTPGSGRDLGHGIYDLGNGTYRYKNRHIPAEYFTDFLKILGYRTSTKNKNAVIVGDGPDSDESEDTYLVLIDQLLAKKKTVKQSTTDSDNTPDSGRDLGHGIYDLGNGTYRYKNRYIPSEYFTDFLNILGYHTSTKNKKTVIVGDGPGSDKSEDTYLVLIDQLLAKKKTVNQSTTNSDNTPGSGRDLGHGIYDLGNGTYRYKNRYIPSEYFTDFLNILGYRTSTEKSKTVIVGDGPKSKESEETYLVLIDKLLAKKKTVKKVTTNTDNTTDSSETTNTQPTTESADNVKIKQSKGKGKGTKIVITISKSSNNAGSKVTNVTINNGSANTNVPDDSSTPEDGNNNGKLSRRRPKKPVEDRDDDDSNNEDDDSNNISTPSPASDDSSTSSSSDSSSSSSTTDDDTSSTAASSSDADSNLSTSIKKSKTITISSGNQEDKKTSNKTLSIGTTAESSNSSNNSSNTDDELNKENTDGTDNSCGDSDTSVVCALSSNQGEKGRKKSKLDESGQLSAATSNITGSVITSKDSSNSSNSSSELSIEKSSRTINQLSSGQKNDGKNSNKTKSTSDDSSTGANSTNSSNADGVHNKQEKEEKKKQKSQKTSNKPNFDDNDTIDGSKEDAYGSDSLSTDSSTSSGESSSKNEKKEGGKKSRASKETGVATTTETAKSDNSNSSSDDNSRSTNAGTSNSGTVLKKSTSSSSSNSSETAKSSENSTSNKKKKRTARKGSDSQRERSSGANKKKKTNGGKSSTYKSSSQQSQSQSSAQKSSSSEERDSNGTIKQSKQESSSQESSSSSTSSTEINNSDGSSSMQASYSQQEEKSASSSSSAESTKTDGDGNTMESQHTEFSSHQEESSSSSFKSSKSIENDSM